MMVIFWFGLLFWYSFFTTVLFEVIFFRKKKQAACKQNILYAFLQGDKLLKNYCFQFRMVRLFILQGPWEEVST